MQTSRAASPAAPPESREKSRSNAAAKEKATLQNQIHFVDTWAGAAQACAVIKTKAVVGLDMELVAGGKTTAIVQMAVGEGEAYIFDALSLGQSLFDACYLLPILVDPKIIKLCYDCRGDAETLFNHHGVRAFGLYDLQIVFTSLFQARADPYLKGLRRAVQHLLSPEHARDFVAGKTAMKRRFVAAELLLADEACASSCIMSERPLSEETLLYCAQDAAILLRMHAAWCRRVETEEVVRATLARAARHIFRRGHRRPGDEAFMHHIDFPRLCCAAPPCAPDNYCYHRAYYYYNDWRCCAAAQSYHSRYHHAGPTVYTCVHTPSFSA